MPKLISHMTGETLDVSEREATDLLRMGIASKPIKKTSAKKSEEAPRAKKDSETKKEPTDNDNERTS